MQRIPLKAEEREVLGKKVKKLREDGLIPGHVFGHNLETEHVMVQIKDFLPVLGQAGETGLIDLKIGAEKVRPVMIKGTQHDIRSGKLIHVDFYQVNLSQKVQVPVPIELIGEESELIHLGEAVILQTLNEVQVEALPTDLIEKIEVDITVLQTIGDAVTVAQLNVDKDLITILAEPEEVVVKMDDAVTEEMKKLMLEQEAEAAEAAAAAAESEEGAEAEVAEGEGAEGETVEGGESVSAEAAEGEAGESDSGSEPAEKPEKPE